jgi:hypothetical protein
MKIVLSQLIRLAIVSGVLLGDLGCQTTSVATKPGTRVITDNSSGYDYNRQTDFKNVGPLSYYALAGGSPTTRSTTQPSFAVIAQQLRLLSRNWIDKRRLDISFEQRAPTVLLGVLSPIARLQGQRSNIPVGPTFVLDVMDEPNQIVLLDASSGTLPFNSPPLWLGIHRFAQGVASDTGTAVFAQSPNAGFDIAQKRITISQIRIVAPVATYLVEVDNQSYVLTINWRDSSAGLTELAHEKASGRR